MTIGATHKRHRAHGQSFVFLRIDSATGMVEWRGWEVSRALTVNKSWFTHDMCRLDFT